MKVVAKKINTESGLFTEGKVYKAKYWKDGLFVIEETNGYKRVCKFKGCAHIEADWTIIGNPAVAIPLDEFNKMELEK